MDRAFANIDLQGGGYESGRKAAIHGNHGVKQIVKNLIRHDPLNAFIISRITVTFVSESRIRV